MSTSAAAARCLATSHNKHHVTWRRLPRQLSRSQWRSTWNCCCICCLE